MWIAVTTGIVINLIALLVRYRPRRRSTARRTRVALLLALLVPAAWVVFAISEAHRHELSRRDTVLAAAISLSIGILLLRVQCHDSTRGGDS
jgi:hypothetical protein